MSEAKKEILSRIEGALKDVPETDQKSNIRSGQDYRQQGDRSSEEIVDLFVERVAEYKATVKRINESELQQVMDASFVAQKVENLVVPPGFPDDWLPNTIHPQYDDPESPLSHDELDQSDGVVTTCALAVAQTGTIILDAGAGQGRRALTLLPDYHLCIVRADQIVELVPEGFAYFEESIKNDGPPITFISGPSATSDIELSRVEGVHGPRRLEVLVLDNK
ncbi:lactate utilization protein C [Aliifodinibius salicampi]|uniref:Lactate utilization protein C n=1 Tax=Fodinibius salicampi TaxID=1920655 RepID=A0ABT3PZQ0_9BACT|nr:lactate utilization protein C [Fodinibius salicampi]MCW9713298.1 lactate utilization protein C [Fodinibius salicampi]